jgi:hypothetical protein
MKILSITSTLWVKTAGGLILVYLGILSSPLSAEGLDPTRPVMGVESIEVSQEDHNQGSDENNGGGTDSNGCEGCPNLYIITVNGINASLEHPLHSWVIAHFPDIYGYRSYDPYETQPGEEHEGMIEWCQSSPSLVGEEIRNIIDSIKQGDPCARVIVVGHSAGAIAAYYAAGSSDCEVLVDPPLGWYPFGGVVCPFQRDLDNAGRKNIKKHPGYVKTEPHDPWLVQTPDSCASLLKIEDAINACIESVLPEECQGSSNPSGLDCLKTDLPSVATPEVDRFFNATP